ncbi:MAG: hypothetical protein ACREYF_19110 [Gammaproteobacteria bacterium]
MSEMLETIGQLDAKTGVDIAQVIATQRDRAFQQIQTFDERLTKINFFTNGGAAVATVALLGIEKIELFLVMVPLAFFVLGVIATVIELRALLSYWGYLLKDAIRRHQGFLDNQLSVKECLVEPSIGSWPKKLNHWAGVIAQLAFVAGVVSGIVGFVCAAP